MGGSNIYVFGKSLEYYCGNSIQLRSSRFPFPILTPRQTNSKCVFCFEILVVKIFKLIISKLISLVSLSKTPPELGQFDVGQWSTRSSTTLLSLGGTGDIGQDLSTSYT